MQKSQAPCAMDVDKAGEHVVLSRVMTRMVIRSSRVRAEAFAVPSGCGTREGVQRIFSCVAGKFELDSFLVTYVLGQCYLETIEIPA